MKDKKNNFNIKKGFTLVEVLLYVLITGIIIFSIAVFSNVIVASQAKNQTIAEVEQQGVQILQQISQALRASSSVSVPAQGASGANLTLIMPSAPTPVAFDLNSGSIRIGEGSPATYTNLTSSRVVASGLTFQNLSRSNTPGIVRVEFTLSHINPGARMEYDFSKTFSTSFGLRY